MSLDPTNHDHVSTSSTSCGSLSSAPAGSHSSHQVNRILVDGAIAVLDFGLQTLPVAQGDLLNETPAGEIS